MKNRGARDELIATMFKEGRRVAEIADWVQLKPPQVRRILKAREVLENKPRSDWETDDSADKLRLAIRRRAARGARAALDAISQSASVVA